MKQFLKKIPVGVLSAIAVVVIAYLSLSSDPLSGMRMHLFPHSDKVTHILMYFFAAIFFLTDYAKFRMPHHTKLNVEAALTAVAILMGLIMEVLQLVMQIGRGYDNLDIAANTIGALLGFAFMRWKGLHEVRVMLSHSSHRHHHHHHHRNDGLTEEES